MRNVLERKRLKILPVIYHGGFFSVKEEIEEMGKLWIYRFYK
jgi:hypothetical protein